MKYRFKSLVDQKASDLASHVDFQVAIVSASWERRSQACISLLNTIKFARLIVIRFPNHGTTGMSGSIRSGYKSFCKKRGVEHVEIIFDSVSKSYAELAETVRSVDTALGSAKRVLIDISSTPRMLWASLLGLWHIKNSIRLVTFIYSRPRYFFVENPRRELIFDYTQGEWSLCDPAFFPSVHSGRLYKSNIVSIGYEYDHIKKIIYKIEADNNTFVYSKPGFQLEYSDMAEATVQKIKNVFEIPEKSLLSCAVNDFEGLCLALDEIIARTRNKKGGSVMLICAGSKIHSLAFVFAALRNNQVVIKLRVPTRYKEVSTEWTGTMEAISVENVFCPL